MAHSLGSVAGQEVGPCFPKVLGVKQVGIKVSLAVVVDHHPCLRGVDGTGAHLRNPGALRQTLDAASRPGAAAVAGKLHVAVVAAGPDESFLQRRGSDGQKAGVHFGTGHVKGESARLQKFLFFWVVAGQVGRDDGPRSASVLRVVHMLRAVVNSVGVKGVRCDGAVPMPTQGLAIGMGRLDVGFYSV